MKFNLDSRIGFFLRNNMPECFFAIIAIVVSVYLGCNVEIFNFTLLLRVLISIVAIFASLFIFRSSKIWITILICFMLVRDFSLIGLFGDGSLKIGDIFVFLIFTVLVLNKHFFEKPGKFLKSNLDLVIVLFILVHALSLFWSVNFEFGLLRVLKLVRNFCLYITIRELFIEDFEGSYKKATSAYIITGIILLIVYMWTVLSAGGFSDFVSLYQKQTLGSQDLGALRMRGTGGGLFISGPSDWFIAAMVFIFGSFMLAKSKIQGFIKILLVLIFAITTVTTLSRSAIIVVGIILFVLFLGSLKLGLRKNISVLMLIFLIIAVAGTSLGITQICSKRFKGALKDGSWTERLDYYQAATDAFVHSPVLGIGVGSNFSWQEKYPLNPSRTVHSLPLLVLSETGLIGFVLFILIIFLWLRYLWVVMHRFDIKQHFQGISLAMFAFSVGYFIHTLTVGEFESFEPWLVMGIASAAYNLYQVNKNDFK